MDDLPRLTPRLRLRPFDERDLRAFVAYRSDERVARYQSWSTYGMDDALAFFKQQKGLAFGKQTRQAEHAIQATPTGWVQIAVEQRVIGARRRGRACF